MLSSRTYVRDLCALPNLQRFLAYARNDKYFKSPCLPWFNLFKDIQERFVSKLSTIPPNLPPPPPPPPSDAAQVEAAIRAIIQNAQALADLPAQRLVLRAQIIAAEVAQTAEGAEIILRLQTPPGKGHIEVRVELPPETPPLPPQALLPGTPIEIEIPPRPAGEVPREVLLRILSEAPLPQPVAPLPRTAETPVQVTLEPLPAPAAPPAPLSPADIAKLPPLEPGQTVRLQPLPPALAAEVSVPEPLETLRPALTANALQPSLSIVTAPAERIEDIPLQPLITPSPLGEGPEGVTPRIYPELGAGGITVVAPQNNPAEPPIPSASPLFPPPTDTPEGKPFTPLTPRAESTPQTLSLVVESIKTPGITPEEQAPAVTKSNAKPDVITAQVSGFVKNSIPVVQLALPGFTPGLGGEGLPLFLLYTPQAGNIGIGTELTLSLPQEAKAASNPSTIAAAVQALAQNIPPYAIPLLSPQGWPVMDEIAQSLAAASPQAAQALSNLTPSAAKPQQMPAAVLFFMAALRAGDLQSWLGEKALDTLKQTGKQGALSRLLGEADQFTGLSRENLSGDWRALALPMHWQTETQKIALYYRHEAESEGEGDSDQGGGKGTRFIMDLALSHMGPVQLDGYARPKVFDLIVRTAEPFSAAARHTMRGLFAGALEIEGLKGDLGFQSKPESWVRIGPGEQHMVVSV